MHAELDYMLTHAQTHPHRDAPSAMQDQQSSRVSAEL